jgi:hypothetical protein
VVFLCKTTLITSSLVSQTEFVGSLKLIKQREMKVCQCKEPFSRILNWLLSESGDSTYYVYNAYDQNTTVLELVAVCMGTRLARGMASKKSTSDLVQIKTSSGK